MSDETVAQARRARIEALNEAIRWQEKLRTQIIPDQIDRYTEELERLLDHEKAPDDEEEEKAPYLIIQDRDVQIARLLDTVASNEKAMADQEAEIRSLRQVIDKDATQIALQEDSIESLQASVARQSETIGRQSDVMNVRADRIRELEEAIEQIYKIVS